MAWRIHIGTSVVRPAPGIPCIRSKSLDGNVPCFVLIGRQEHVNGHGQQSAVQGRTMGPRRQQDRARNRESGKSHWAVALTKLPAVSIRRRGSPCDRESGLSKRPRARCPFPGPSRLSPNGQAIYRAGYEERSPPCSPNFERVIGFAIIHFRSQFE